MKFAILYLLPTCACDGSTHYLASHGSGVIARETPVSDYSAMRAAADLFTVSDMIKQCEDNVITVLALTNGYLVYEHTASEFSGSSSEDVVIHGYQIRDFLEEAFNEKEVSDADVKKEVAA